MSTEDNKKPFWSGMTGIIGAVAALIVAITGLLTALFGTGILRDDAEPSASATNTVLVPTRTLTNSQSNNPAPSTAPQAQLPLIGTDSNNLADCLGIPLGELLTIEAGLLDVLVSESEQPVNHSTAISFTDTGNPIGGLRYTSLFSGNNAVLFKIDSVVNSRCTRIREYMPLGRTGHQNTMQNWDDLCLQFGNELYLLGLGWDVETPVTADFQKLSDVSDPTSADCQQSIAQVP